ncbi:SseB family protein [Sagittula sp. SSi028]|uniref:SseB family protein n=1 Tax=Sagittula sp. SSi028 TaxID=3400636 RepID=UPI003AF8C983
MTDATPLDSALAAMNAAPEDETLRMRFYDRLASAELYLMLEREPEGDTIDPEVFDVADAKFLLAFDREHRLSEFAARAVPYVALSGRALAGMLAGQGIGIALNAGTAGETLLPPEAMGWLAETLGHAPQSDEARIERLHPPKGLPENLLVALDAKLATAAGLAETAWLSAATYEGGARGHILGIIGAPSGAEPALAGAVQEALVFSGLEAGALDVTFLTQSDPLAAELVRTGLRFDLPQLQQPRTEIVRPAPGSDPDKPPILR